MAAGQVAAAVEGESGRDGGDGWEAVELAIRTAMLELGGSLLGRLLAADPGHRGPRIDCGAGHQAEFIAYRDKTLHTVLGPVALRRAWYHCAVCGHGHAPRDEELGVAGTSLTPGLRRMIDRAGAAAPFAPAVGLLSDLAGVDVNAKAVQRAAEVDGRAAAAVITARAEAIRARTLVPLPPSPMPDILYVAIDGTGVPMTATETAGRAGKTARPDGQGSTLPDDGRARTREVKLACLFTQTELNDDGYPVRDPDSSSYLASFAPAHEFGPLVAAEARRRGGDHVRQLVVLGDGAVWIWKLAGKLLPEATQIVDIYHAREHLHDLAATLAFIVTDPAQWLRERLDELDARDIEAIIAAATAPEYPLVGVKAVDRDKALTYFRTNTVRRRYAHYRKHGMFIGSGNVEAGCKAVIGQRLKLSGRHWTTPGATGILTLRCQQASGPWDHLWTRPHNQIPDTHLAPCRT
ncbi:MAG: hypothetical protein QG597_4868 [Actinomycetota bacterium]|nr:hypothetical protein [Actinomycetota bacterium]